MLSRQEINKIKRHAYNRFPNRTTVNILKLISHIKSLERKNRRLDLEVTRNQMTINYLRDRITARDNRYYDNVY